MKTSFPFGFPRKIAEIGVLEGEMSKRLLSKYPAIEQYWGIDPYIVYEKAGGMFINAKVKTQEEWEHLYARTTIYMRIYPQFRLLRMTSKEASKYFPDEFFDSIFVDGNHLYEYVKTDILCWMPKIKKGGLLCGHDYGVKRTPGVKKAVDELIEHPIILENEYTWLYIVR